MEDKSYGWSTRKDYKYVAVDQQTYDLIRHWSEVECRNLGKQLRWIVGEYKSEKVDLEKLQTNKG